jgi:hypothetical protein
MRPTNGCCANCTGQVHPSMLCICYLDCLSYSAFNISSAPPDGWHSFDGHFPFGQITDDTQLAREVILGAVDAWSEAPVQSRVSGDWFDASVVAKRFAAMYKDHKMVLDCILQSRAVQCYQYLLYTPHFRLGVVTLHVSRLRKSFKVCHTTERVVVAPATAPRRVPSPWALCTAPASCFRQIALRLTPPWQPLMPRMRQP